jgi:hypothetical protein
VTFTSPTAGTVKGHASVTFSIGGESVTRETDGTSPNSDDAVKVFVAGSLSWTKVDNAGTLQGGAVFTVCKTNNYLLPDGGIDEANPLDPAVCFDVADNVDGDIDLGDLDADGAPGKFKITGLSLGRYTVKEKTAPAGYTPDPDTETVDLVPGAIDGSVDSAFVNQREILKITGFGYTNEATGTPTSGIVSGETTFTVNLHNYGGSVANLTSSSLVVSSDLTDGTLTCDGNGADQYTLDITGTVAAGADAGPFAITCTYTGLNDGAQVIADLVVKSTTNGTEREASGSPAQIRFTVQAD